MKKKWRTLGAKWFMSYDHSNVICLEEECDLQICHTLATSDEKLRGGRNYVSAAMVINEISTFCGGSDK